MRAAASVINLLLQRAIRPLGSGGGELPEEAVSILNRLDFVRVDVLAAIDRLQGDHIGSQIGFAILRQPIVRSLLGGGIAFQLADDRNQPQAIDR